MPQSYTVNEILSLISKDFKNSRDSKQIGGNLSCMH